MKETKYIILLVTVMTKVFMMSYKILITLNMLNLTLLWYAEKEKKCCFKVTLYRLIPVLSGARVYC